MALIWQDGDWVNTDDQNQKPGGTSTGSGTGVYQNGDWVTPPNDVTVPGSSTGSGTGTYQDGGWWTSQPHGPPDRVPGPANIGPGTPGMPGTQGMPSPTPDRYAKNYADASYGANPNNSGNYGNNFISLQQYMRANSGSQQRPANLGDKSTPRDMQGNLAPGSGYTPGMYGIDSSMYQAFGGSYKTPFVQGGDQSRANTPGLDTSQGQSAQGSGADAGSASNSGPGASGGGGSGPTIADSGLYGGRAGGLDPSPNFGGLQNRMRGYTP